MKAEPKADFRGRLTGLARSLPSWLVSHRAVIILLIGILLFHAANNWWVLRNDNVYFSSDQAFSYRRSAVLTQQWKQTPLLRKPTFLLSETSVIPSVVFPGIPALILSYAGYSQDNAVMTNLFFFFIVLCATYCITVQLFDRKTAQYSLVFLSFFPGMIGATRGFGRSLALSAMVALTACFLLSSQGMRRWRHALLFGLFLGLSGLTYPSFSLFLIGPFIFAGALPLLRGWRESGLSAAYQQLRNLLLALGMALFLALPWYLRYTRPFLSQDYFLLSTFGRSAFTDMLLAGAWALSKDIYPIPFILVILAVFVISNCRGRRGFLLSWLLLPLGFYSILPTPQPYHVLRYMLPTLPVVAIILAYLLHASVGFISTRKGLEAARVHDLTMVILLFLGVVLLVKLTYLRPATLLDPQGVPEGWVIEPLLLNSGGRLSPMSIEADIGSVADVLSSDFSRREKTQRIFILNPYGFISEMLLSELDTRQILQEGGSFAEGSCVAQPELDTISWLDAESCIRVIESSDYLLLEEFGAAFLSEEILLQWPIKAPLEYLERELENYTPMAEVPNADMGYYFHLNSTAFLRDRALVLKRPVTQRE